MFLLTFFLYFVKLKGIELTRWRLFMYIKKKKKKKNKLSMKSVIYIVIIIAGLFVISYVSVYLMSGILAKGPSGL
jgi:hypothetical protein